MSDLPGGTVTFLFSDIEGSTRLWETEPAGMRLALARHDALVRAVIDRHGGTVFKTVGDAFCAAFPTALPALEAARAVQHALAREPWPPGARIAVRIALHSGAVEMRDNDFFGPPLNRTARLLAAGHGGQVLLSQATAALVRDDLPADVGLRDLGERRLKDLIRQERVYQLVAPELRADFPPLRTLDARPHNLPVQATSFVGRDREMGEVRSLLATSRIVTLTGTGGAGKTRLALEVSADRIDDFADGVWFVDLAPLTDGRHVVQAVATVLRVREDPGTDILATLAEALRARQLLLLLDNCEHVVDDSARLCEAIVAAAPELRVLATSREALRVAGERTYRVPSLPAPDTLAMRSVESLTQYAAVRLFVDRARAANAAFHVNDANAPAVASICHHLDGIPLAIELAAARIRAMSAQEIHERLDHRFGLLTGGVRTALPRQQTLRSALDWSYDLLGAAERALFGRLAVFAGSWSESDAEAVCAGDGVDPAAVLDLVSALVDKSLVFAEEVGGTTRYRLLETMREYARERLRASGEEARCLSRLLAHLLMLAKLAAPHLRGGAAQQTWLERVEVEHDNLRATLAWAAQTDAESASGLRLAGALWRHWYEQGRASEGLPLLEALLSAVGERALVSDRGRVHDGCAVLSIVRGDYARARSHAERALALFRSIGDSPGIACALHRIATLCLEQDDAAEAHRLYQESLALSRAAEDRTAIAVTLSCLGSLAYRRGDLPAAESCFRESLAIHEAMGDRRHVGALLNGLGLVAHQRCNDVDAATLFAQAASLAQELGDVSGTAQSLNHLGLVAEECGDLAAARRHYEESLAAWRAIGATSQVAQLLNNLGTLACNGRDYAAARMFHAEALAVRRRLGDRHGIAESLNNVANVDEGCCDVAGARAAYLESAPIWHALGNRRGLAQTLEGLGRVALALGGPGVAAQLMGAANRLRTEAGTPLPPTERLEVERGMAGARAALGASDAFDEGWKLGQSMDVAQAFTAAMDVGRMPMPDSIRDCRGIT